MEVTSVLAVAAFLGAVCGLLLAYRQYSRRLSIEVIDVLRWCHPSYRY